MNRPYNTCIHTHNKMPTTAMSPMERTQQADAQRDNFRCDQDFSFLSFASTLCPSLPLPLCCVVAQLPFSFFECVAVNGKRQLCTARTFSSQLHVLVYMRDAFVCIYSNKHTHCVPWNNKTRKKKKVTQIIYDRDTFTLLGKYYRRRFAIISKRGYSFKYIKCKKRKKKKILENIRSSLRERVQLACVCMCMCAIHTQQQQPHRTKVRKKSENAPCMEYISNDTQELHVEYG